MKIAISGASGFIGSHLSAYMQRQGGVVVPLGREDLMPGGQERLASLLAGCDAVVNLAGAPIAHRWTAAYKEELYASRVDTTRRLVEAVNRNGSIRTFVSTSAVGFYPSVGCYDEQDQEPGAGFLSHLCVHWEAEARKVETRCVITRFGVVLSAEGGAFPRMVAPLERGVGLVAGSGLQPFSWIALEDLMRGIAFVLLRPDLQGVFNLTAPEKLTMREFMAAAGKHYGVWFSLNAPAFAVRWALGESSAFVLEGQCVVPQRLLEEGFVFTMPAAEDFLRAL